jgi:hypothetical protein
MLGVLIPGSVADAGLYRHPFLSSPAVGDCSERTEEVRRLFQRLVEMIAQFSNQPKLPEVESRPITDPQIRITPSKVGDVPLSDQAIPYYYKQEGTPPLYRLWDLEKNRRNRAHHNLGYRSDEYTPAAPAFVREALRYDLEPYNFLRIEGHLGKEYQNVLNTLLSFKARYRLPIDIIALRAGSFDEDISVDLSKEKCRFQDLETLYDAFREELLCTLAEGARFLYDVLIEGQEIPRPGDGTAQLPLLKTHAGNFTVRANTVGAWYEKYLASFQARPYIDVDQSKIDQNAVFIVYCSLFTGTLAPPPQYYAHVVGIYYFSKLAEVLPATLDALKFADFENKYQDLIELVRFLRSDAVSKLSAELVKFIPQEELIDHFDEVLLSCKLEAIREIQNEFTRRLREVKQKQFLSVFLRDHPGIQHKAGVPPGGTFILVYHKEPASLKKDLNLEAVKAETSSVIPMGRKIMVAKEALSEALTRMIKKEEYAEDDDMKVLFGALTGRIPDFNRFRGSISAADKIIDATVEQLADGNVIADFFLPYLCCPGCQSVQFVLPKNPPTFTIEMECTDPATKTAEATVTPKGGEGHYTYQLDDSDVFIPLTGKLVLPAGAHTLVIQDSAGTESAPRSFTVPEPLMIGKETYGDNVAAKTYQVSFGISGGTPPYQADTGTITGNLFTSAAVKSGEAATVTITDGAGCKVSKQFKHAICDLPCAGIAQRCGFRFWLPETAGNQPYRQYSGKVPIFTFEFPQGATVDLAQDVERVIQARPEDLTQDFNRVVQSWVKRINTLISRVTQNEDWLRLAYVKSAADVAGTLLIEYFECLKFEFQITASFQRPEVQETVSMSYTPVRTAFTIDDIKAAIPAFNCVQINKCDPERPEVPRCGKVDLDLTIVKDVSRASATLDVNHTGADAPVAFLWEVQDGVPALSNKKKASFKFSNREPRQKTIRLTAFTEGGCTVTKMDTIELTG